MKAPTSNLITSVEAGEKDYSAGATELLLQQVRVTLRGQAGQLRQLDQNLSGAQRSNRRYPHSINLFHNAPPFRFGVLFLIG